MITCHPLYIKRLTCSCSDLHWAQVTNTITPEKSESTKHYTSNSRAANNSQSLDNGQKKFTHVQPKPNCGQT